jgi:hypothetical protein
MSKNRKRFIGALIGLLLWRRLGDADRLLR